MNSSSRRRVAVVIEDDADIRELLRAILTQSGFEPVLTGSGEEGIAAVRAHEPVLTTLDVNMPGMDGFAVAKRLREFSDTYIIMLTGQSDEIDVVQGLDSGADDYVVKPFRPRELRARIESLLRRPRTAAPAEEAPAPVSVIAEPVVRPAVPVVPAVTPPPARAPEPAAPAPPVATVPQQTPAASVAAPAATVGDDALSWKGLTVNVATRVATVDGRAVDLTRSEFDLLAALLSSGRRVRSKADLVLTLRGEGYVTTYFVNDADKRAVETHMANLRRKIGDSSTTPRWIETVRGVGYRLAED
ncbi:MAG: response regulator transcription factor [Aeromicrobium sp.]|uniref:response regulator transcription factor n=1 Tax=Aeromicrobium sp. TaxID=1871063 RepID=UPI0039E566A1